MKKLTPVVSIEVPNVRDALWLKPVDGGFALYALFNGKWQPLKLVDDNNTASEDDDTVLITEVGAMIDVYDFSFYGDSAGTQDWADGVVAATGNTIKSGNVTYKEVMLLANVGQSAGVAAFEIGSKYYVPSDTPADGTTISQLYDSTPSELPVYVKINPPRKSTVEEKRVFNKYI